MNTSPFISVVVLCRNEKDFIATCLNSLIATDYPKDRLEVLVVDGMSQDGTREIVESYSHEHAFLKLVDNPKQIPAAAANQGITIASGELVIIAGAHAVYPADYISKCVTYSRIYSTADNVGGVRWTVPRDSTIMGRSIAYVSCHPFGAGAAAYHRSGKSPRWVDSVWGGCYRKEVFQRMGPYNEALVVGEDREFNQRLRASGGRILQVPDIECTYYARSRFLEYCGWAFRMGFWPFYARKIVGRRLVSLRNYVPLAFLASLVLSMAATWVTFVGWRVFCGIIVVHGIASIASAATLVRRQRDHRYLMAAFVFFVTHVLYGIGSLYAILKAWPLPDAQASELKPMPASKASAPHADVA